MATRNTPSLIDVAKEFGTEEQCIDYLEAMRWPGGVRCVRCDGDNISKFTVPPSITKRSRKNVKTGLVEVRESRVPERHLYQCMNPECKHQFSATAGTIFSDSHSPLSTWFMATALVVNAKKGLSAKQLERDLHVSYPTAWFLYHRIREAMADGGDGIFTGEVEVDCTFVGSRRYDKRTKRARWKGKPAVAGILQRSTETDNSRVKIMRVQSEILKEMRPVIADNVDRSATVYTDENSSYHHLNRIQPHEIVCHSKDEWVRGRAHTNGIENFWSLFKRGLIGSYHQVSIKHLMRYLNEFQFRFNNREAEDLFMLVLLQLVAGSPLRRAVLTSGPKASMPKDDPSV